MAEIHLHERPALIYSVGLLLLGRPVHVDGLLAELFIAYHDPEIKSYSMSDRAGRRKKSPRSLRERARVRALCGRNSSEIRRLAKRRPSP